jgi:exonuclease III
MLRKLASTHIIKNMPVYWESYIRGCSKALTRTIIDCALDHHNIDIACIQETKLRTSKLTTDNYEWHLSGSTGVLQEYQGTAIIISKKANCT